MHFYGGFFSFPRGLGDQSDQIKGLYDDYGEGLKRGILRGFSGAFDPGNLC